MDQISETSEHTQGVEDLPKLTEQNVDNNLVQTILKEINNAQSMNSETAPSSQSSQSAPPTHAYQQIPSNVHFQMPQEIPSEIPREFAKQQRPMQMNSPDYMNSGGLYNMQPYLYNQKMMDIINNEDTIFNKLTKHIKETFIVLLLFVLLSCETTRSACAINIPKLGNTNKSLNLFGTILLSVIYGIIYICMKQFM